MEHDGDSQTPPSWFQPPTPTSSRRRPPPINPAVLILILTGLALLVFYLLVPPFLSNTNQIPRPTSVKRSWDSFNVVLVFFAVLCGVFARRNDAEENEPITVSNNVSGLDNVRSRSPFPAWPDVHVTGDVSSGGRLRRSGGSYPDLRKESIWGDRDENRARFFDDLDVGVYRSPARTEGVDSRRRRRSYEAKRGDIETRVKEIPVDKFEVRSAAPKSSAPPPPPPPPPAAAVKRRRSVHSAPRRDEAEVNVVSENRRPVPAPPPPPPVEEITEKFRRKKSGTKEIATAIASLYKDQRKRNKRVIKIRNVFDSVAQNSAAEPQIPPPPPPPPPSKLLQNLFKKSGKSKRAHSSPATTPPPPPPPPPNSIFVNLFKSKRFQPSSSTPPPPPPSSPPTSQLLNSLFKKESNNTQRFIPPPPPPPRRQIITGKPPKPSKQDTKLFVAPPSPLIPLPPPPPPPIFAIPKPRFVARGDFVRIRSAHSSRCSSPELEDVDVDSPVKSDGGPAISCPSPDVNVKADTFIARLRDEWRLEKEVKEKRVSG